MGTNYYFRTNWCKECNRYDQMHIGKKSCGWVFLFQAHPNMNCLADVKKLADKYPIYDEYDRLIPKEEFFNKIQKTSGEQHTSGMGTVTVDGFDWMPYWGSNGPNSFE